MDLKKNTFVRWSSRDDEGSFSHVGQVVSTSKTHVTLDLGQPGGVLTVEKSDGTFSRARKPRKWDVRSEAPLKTVSRAKKPKKTKLSARMLEVVALLKGKGLSRKESIALIVAELGMSTAGASTYYNTARKHI